MFMKLLTIKPTLITILGVLGIGFSLYIPTVGAATDPALIDALIENGALTKAQAEALTKNQAETLSNKAGGTDPALLDALVKNGALTKAQAETLTKNQTVAVSNETAGTIFKTKSNKVWEVEFSGLLHGQYDNISTNDFTPGVRKPDSVNSATLRRVHIGATVKLPNDWSGVFSGRLNDNTADLDKAYIAKGYNGGAIKAGLDKVNFGYEENTLPGNIKAVERSMVTNYFTQGLNTRQIGIGGRHIGLFVDGAWNGFGYGAAITNGFEGGADAEDGDNNELAYYTNAYYKKTFQGDKSFFQTGINLGYKPEGNTENTANLKSSIFGYNPYLAVKWDRFRLVGEYLRANVRNGRQGAAWQRAASSSKPWGYNIIPSYRIMDAFEVVLRYSHFDGDGRGIQISDGIRRANDPDSDPSYDKADSYYAGLNWYVTDHVKLSAGYEHVQFDGRLDGSGTTLIGGKDADTRIFRTRLQAHF